MSTILVDNLTGKTSAGDITVTSEGGAATQSLQQGLAKAWLHFDGSGTPSIDDSLNIASITDVSTALYIPTFSNNMSVSGGYTASGGGSWSGAGSFGAFITFEGNGYATTGVKIVSYVTSNYTLIEAIDITVDYHGDLA